LEQNLRELCRALRLDDHVRFLGFVEKLADFLPLADMQVHPSHSEGVPLAVCSGMAAGLPIIASDIGGLHEVLKNGLTGVLVPPRDERAFTEAVVALIENPGRARRLGEAARRFIENDYSLDQAAAALEQSYREVMARCA
jgi:L-malate glycosyltransferase